MPTATLVAKLYHPNGDPIDGTNPLPVTEGGGGGTQDVDIVNFSSPAPIATVVAEIIYNTIGYEVLTIDVTAVGLTVPAGATKAFVTFELGDVRTVWHTGGVATPTVGNLILKGDTLFLDSLADLNNFSAIRDAAATAAGIAHVNYAQKV